MSTLEITKLLEAFKAGKVSQAEVLRLTSGATRKAKFQVKRNAKGGTFIQHPDVTGYSSEKCKNYVASINLPVGVAETLFADDARLLEIAKAVREMVASEKN